VQFTLKQLGYFVAAGEAGSQFRREQISTEKIPGMAKL
jgi:hypothetical protein